MPPNTNQATVLIVDDVPSNIRLLAHILQQDYQILFATNGIDAIECANTNLPDLILLDIMLPEISGFTICEKLRDNDRTHDIPVIIVTTLNDSTSETLGFASGAVDFLSKPVNPPVVRARVAVHLALKKQREILTKTNKQLQTEIQQRQILENQLREQAEFDALTGLPNRKLFQDRLQQTLLMGERTQGKFALLFVDLDRFKWVNDTLGHDAGDQLLIEAAKRMQSMVRKSDTVARLGGDEFTIILSNILHDAMAELVARKVLEQLATPFMLKGEKADISGSIGIAIFPTDGCSAIDLSKNADAAMYQAKESGRNTFRFFSQELNLQASKRMNLETEIRHACEHHEFFLDYQPKINLSTGQIYGVEALVRWNHPLKGILFPHQFLPMAEGTGMMMQIETWILRTACRETVFWAKQGFPDLKLAVNLSGMQFREGDKLVALIKQILHETKLAPQKLELEITETIMMNNSEQIEATLNQLSSMGITITMDDFGTGLSSLALLKRLPFQILKIDRTFIKSLQEDATNTACIAAIFSIAQQLNLHVVVEGIETADQLQIIKKQGGKNTQGFYFSPPVGQDTFLAILRGQLPLGGLH